MFADVHLYFARHTTANISTYSITPLRAEILQNFQLLFWKIADFINSFWLNLTFKPLHTFWNIILSFLKTWPKLTNPSRTFRTCPKRHMSQIDKIVLNHGHAKSKWLLNPNSIWFNKINWCEGHQFRSISMVVRLSEVSSKKG